MKNLLIEHWLPIAAIGAESQRERSSMTALPPTYYLHVWWARRPLTTSRAAILTSVLPQWSADFPTDLREKFPNEATYHQWVEFLLGIRGDPVKGRKLVAWANDKGIKLDVHPYGGAPRAFTVNPSAEDLQTMGDLLEWTWGKRDLSVLDPFAGGGSIPFESLRYGFSTYANDLNPVAATILKATLDYPARYGSSLAGDIRKWGNEWAKRVKTKLDPYFPKQLNESIYAYLWARAVDCPTTGKPVPLSPNWWLNSSGTPVAVRMIANPEMETPQFEIVTGSQTKDTKPDEGTLAHGVARSPWTGETIDSDYIKTEAQAGRMGQILYAIGSKKGGGVEFRVPIVDDISAIKNADKALLSKKTGWVAKNIIPSEAFPSGNDSRPLMYGMATWADFFSPRQLLAMGTLVETLAKLQPEIKSTHGPERANAILTYLGMALDKCPNYSSLLASWHAPRGVMRSVFDRHDFSFKWTYGEFDAAGNLLPWALNQVIKAYSELVDLVAPVQQSLTKAKIENPIERLTITQGTATNLANLPDASIDNITVDPPYYANVQYAELSDFFYVWLKRSVGHLYPEFFRDELTNKDDEAVANPARFESMGKKKKVLAKQDYENKMSAAFREMYRVLRPEGALTVMFTHRDVEAWDTLASALIGAGFRIKASWPVHTESEHSLHQAKKNAAASTILLVCRKRSSPKFALSEFGGDREGAGEEQTVWWDDIKETVRRVAREKATEFAAAGISGVDLYISTFGPALSVISEHWPVLTSEIDPKTGHPKALRPETALDLAREEVIRMRKERLLTGNSSPKFAEFGGGREGVRFDPFTDWTLMAWDAFAAVEFPYDEARKLAIALGVDLDKTILSAKRLAVKKSSSVVLQEPSARRKKGMVDEDALLFEHWIDAAHTALMLYAEDGAGACDVFLRRLNLKNDPTFKALIQSMLNAIPRAKIKGKFVRPEAETLENLRLAFYPEMTVPVEEAPKLPVEKQLGLFADERREEE